MNRTILAVVQPVIFYEYFSNGSFRTLYGNKSLIYYPLQVVDNSTALEFHWIDTDGSSTTTTSTLTAFWSPSYGLNSYYNYNSNESLTGSNLYWDGTSWTQGTWTFTVPTTNKSSGTQNLTAKNYLNNTFGPREYHYVLSGSGGSLQ